MSHALSIAAAKARFSECVKQAEGGEAVIITRHGKVVAALVSAEDLAMLSRVRAKPERGTLLSLVGLDDEDFFASEVERIVSSRGLPRPLPDFESV